MRLGIACYVFQRTIDKTCLYRRDTFVEASSLPPLFPFFHASAPLCTRSTETTNGDDERVKANHLPAEYGYAINSKERATSALLFHAAARCETIRTPRAPPKKKPLVNLPSRSRVFPSDPVPDDLSSPRNQEKGQFLSGRAEERNDTRSRRYVFPRRRDCYIVHINRVIKRVYTEG